jgi:hypothetical protein
VCDEHSDVTGGVVPRRHRRCQLPVAHRAIQSRGPTCPGGARRRFRAGCAARCRARQPTRSAVA